jgi:tRNA-(ms[2]io[6]A)-hydroxylase
MLGLLTPTSDRWIEAALTNIEAVLVDHLHCELKAASNATALVSRYPMYPELVMGLTSLAQEELLHVQQVHQELVKRGIKAHPPNEDPYAIALRKASQSETHRAKTDNAPLLDRLTIGALIEARSCERFSILKEHAPTEGLRAWYADLFASEARHYRLFYSLAEQIVGEQAARSRFALLAEHEAQIVSGLPLQARIH